MKSLFEYESYKQFFNDRLESLPKKGHGEMLRAAKHLQIHTSLMSHIFRGEKDLSFEQACALCEYMGLNSLESEYFTLLIQRDKAGTRLARRMIQDKVERIRSDTRKVSSRISYEKKLDDSSRGTFYSNWYYSAIRLMTALESSSDSLQNIAEELQLPTSTISKVIDFLLRQGLIVKEGHKLSVGPNSTHIDADSPFSFSHHRNWRLKALERSGNLKPEELMFTSPMMISKKDQIIIRNEILGLIESSGKIAEPSPSERLVCLNIDLVNINQSAQL